MIRYHSIRTYRDLLAALQMASDEQLDLPIQCTDSHPVDEYVHKLKQAICLGTVDELELRYARSVVDNRRNGSELVLFCDGNPFGEDGTTGYTMKNRTDELDESKDLKDRFEPIFPKDHEDSRDWTGPAQLLADRERPPTGHGTLNEILASRIEKPRLDVD